MPRRDIIIPQSTGYDLFGGHCFTIMGETEHHKGRAFLMVGQGAFSMIAYIPPATLREIAAALVAAADEIEPATNKDVATVAALIQATTVGPSGCPQCDKKPGAGHSEGCPLSNDDSTDTLLQPTAPAVTCTDCMGDGTIGQDVDEEGRPRLIDCPRCAGVGKLYPTGTAVPGQQVAKFAGIKPALPNAPKCDECGEVFLWGPDHKGTCSKWEPEF